MKRMMLIGLLLCLCLLLPLCAQAESELPGDIQDYFASDAFDGAEIIEQASLLGYGKTDYWFVMIRNAKNESVLYGFKGQNNTWKHWMHTARAVPQGKKYTGVSLLTNAANYRTGKEYGKPVLIIYQLDDGMEYYETSLLFLLENNVWKLNELASFSGGYSIGAADGKLIYYQSMESTKTIGTAKGTVQRDLRYVSFSAIPKTYADAKKKLTSAPEIPDSTELQAQQVNFVGGKKYPVYAAPDETALRGGSNKAVVSTNGWIQVFGEENGWILIQYSIDSAHYRFGYIKADSLPKGADVSTLAFEMRAAQVISAVAVTDDPLYSRASIATLQSGETVTLLAKMGDWAYIENDTASYRGFVPLTALDEILGFEPSDAEG